MMNRAPVSSKERLTVFGAVIGLHIALLCLFLFQRSAIVPTEPKPTTISMIAIDAERPAAAKPSPPTMPSARAKTFKPITELSIADSTANLAAGASTACSTLDAVLDSLLLDTAATEAIRGAPPETRSIAGAVMIWNEGWSPAAAALDSPLGIVRANIEQSLAEVVDSCLDEPLAGPRLLPIPDGSEATILLVIGSGNWSWRTLLLPPAAPTVGLVSAGPAATRQDEM